MRCPLDRSTVPLNPISQPNRNVTTLLGSLGLGPMSGYDLRERIEGPIACFWSQDLGRLYPVLAPPMDEGRHPHRETLERKKGPTMKLITAIVFAVGIALAPATALAGDLRVRIQGISEESGFIRVALFANASDFETSKQMAGIFTIARKSGVEVVFANLPPGRYGVSGFHDVNGNEDLDTTLIGIPKEPFGFSRNARGKLGMPSFEDLFVEIGSEDMTLEIELH